MSGTVEDVHGIWLARIVAQRRLRDNVKTCSTRSADHVHDLSPSFPCSRKRDHRRRSISFRVARTTVAADQFHHAAELSDRLRAVAQRAGRRAFQKKGLDVTILPGKDPRLPFNKSSPAAHFMAAVIRSRWPRRSAKALRSSPSRRSRIARQSWSTARRRNRSATSRTWSAGDRDWRLRQRLRQYPRHDARHERAEARRDPARSGRQQSGGLGSHSTGPLDAPSSASAPPPSSRNKARTSSHGRPTTSSPCPGRPISRSVKPWRKSPICC